MVSGVTEPFIGRDRRRLSKRPVSRVPQRNVAGPTTSRPHNTTDNYEQGRGNRRRLGSERVCDQPRELRDEAKGGKGRNVGTTSGWHRPRTRRRVQSYRILVMSGGPTRWTAPPGLPPTGQSNEARPQGARLGRSRRVGREKRWRAQSPGAHHSFDQRRYQNAGSTRFTFSLTSLESDGSTGGA